MFMGQDMDQLFKEAQEMGELGLCFLYIPKYCQDKVSEDKEEITNKN